MKKNRVTDVQISEAMRRDQNDWSKQSDDWLLARFSLLSDKQQRSLISAYLMHTKTR